MVNGRIKPLISKRTIWRRVVLAGVRGLSRRGKFFGDEGWPRVACRQESNFFPAKVIGVAYGKTALTVQGFGILWITPETYFAGSAGGGPGPDCALGNGYWWEVASMGRQWGGPIAPVSGRCSRHRRQKRIKPAPSTLL